MAHEPDFARRLVSDNEEERLVEGEVDFFDGDVPFIFEATRRTPRTAECSSGGGADAVVAEGDVGFVGGGVNIETSGIVGVFGDGGEIGGFWVKNV